MRVAEAAAGANAGELPCGVAAAIMLAPLLQQIMLAHLLQAPSCTIHATGWPTTLRRNKAASAMRRGSGLQTAAAWGICASKLWSGGALQMVRPKCFSRPSTFGH
jgi:hypothetical protein